MYASPDSSFSYEPGPAQNYLKQEENSSVFLPCKYQQPSHHFSGAAAEVIKVCLKSHIIIEILLRLLLQLFSGFLGFCFSNGSLLCQEFDLLLQILSRRFLYRFSLFFCRSIFWFFFLPKASATFQQPWQQRLLRPRSFPSRFPSSGNLLIT